MAVRGVVAAIIVAAILVLLAPATKLVRRLVNKKNDKYEVTFYSKEGDRAEIRGRGVDNVAYN